MVAPQTISVALNPPSLRSESLSGSSQSPSVASQPQSRPAYLCSFPRDWTAGSSLSFPLKDVVHSSTPHVMCANAAIC